MAGLEKVKVLVIGDSGVGKSSLSHLICHGQPITNPSWTIGASLDVKVHVFRDGTPLQKKYFVELWDVGGCNAHANARSVFYHNVNGNTSFAKNTNENLRKVLILLVFLSMFCLGIILVHDLTNKKSCFNLRNWLSEVLVHVQGDGGCGLTSPLSLTATSDAMSSWWSRDGFDPETFAGSSQLPMLIFGTKQDLTTETRYRKRSPMADECGADEIFLNCLDRTCMPSGSSAAVKLSKFFDKVIERRYHAAGNLMADRRRNPHHNAQFRTFIVDR
ncbi:unnamed protein product [Notodromas monacha]|uniref:Rab-like protein 3 n=1 Tax=Notodromas monacha TaxID=399045 RepID=A0A7R9BVY1_9CRUS|nr:unnamed protein product [Notodromas monacha]CAG0921770.1 unnamed protein product [Notodromas monacha]